MIPDNEFEGEQQWKICILGGKHTSNQSSLFSLWRISCFQGLMFLTHVSIRTIQISYVNGSITASAVHLPWCISATGCASLTQTGWCNSHWHWLLVWLGTPKWQRTVRPFWLRPQQLCFQSRNSRTKGPLSVWVTPVIVLQSTDESMQPFKSICTVSFSSKPRASIDDKRKSLW